ncbi:MAG: Reverse transcriptase domain-containing protein [Shouchella clausii]|jgi:hypothetical protein|uniref:hypothetical protein n=1 Tax=Shouchella tritolerans TaxID=2979466 RepID=UPI000AED8608|nr:hypothetical protein [Shouchella tritolerans]
MKNFKPAFEATQVTSMQWNRTAPMAVAEAANLSKPANISKETLNELKQAIQEEMKL